MLKEDPSPPTHCEHHRGGRVNRGSPDVNTPQAVWRGGSSGIESRKPGWESCPHTLKLLPGLFPNVSELPSLNLGNRNNTLYLRLERANEHGFMPYVF